MVLKSVFPDVVIPEIPLGQYLVDLMERYGDLVALMEMHSGRKVTYKELKEDTLKLVKLLWQAGLRKGDIVGLVLPFDQQYVPLFVAVIYCGAVLFGTKLLFKSAIHDQLAAIKPTLVITTNERFQEIFEDLKDNAPSVKLCLSFDQLLTIQPQSLRSLENDMPCYGAIDVHNDPAIIFQSSGTTGEPKGVVRTHYSMVAVAVIASSFSGTMPGDVTGGILNIIHIQSLAYLCQCVTQGTQLAYASCLTADQHLEFISKYKINTMGIFNVTILKNMIEREAFPLNCDLSPLRLVFVGGTTFPPELIEKAREKLSAVVTMAYGMTEGGIISAGYTNKVPCSSVGLLLSTNELKIVDKDNNAELSCGEKGEICVRGPQVMKEYFLRDGSVMQVTKENGWLHSGDLGYYDKNGFIYVVGRIKDAIKIQPGNVTVMPAELEDILLRHEQIADVAIAGVPHPNHGEAPRAFVVRKDNKLTEKDVVEFFKSKVEGVTSIDGGVEFVEVIPRTEIGKPLRRELLEKSLRK